MFHEIARKSPDVAADVNHLSDEFDAPPRIGLEHRRRNLIKDSPFRKTKYFLQQNFIDSLARASALRRFSKSENLLQQRLCIAHAAVRFPRQ